jgi:predicted AAA+ superfamily ATPase
MKRYIKQFILKDIKKKLVILTGPRQVGKTYMSRQLMTYFQNPIYLNWDIPEHRVRLQKQDWYDQYDLVIMDEIHKMSHWKQWLKGVTDARAPGTALLVTGSARMDTFRQAGESLAGRYYSYRMHPISVKELCSTGDYKPREALEHILQRGGFPEPCLEESLEDVMKWRLEYSKNILREDILEFSRLQELNTMKIFIEILRDRVGSLLSLASIARDIGCSPITLNKYLDILKALFIVFTIQPWHDNVGRSLLKTPKVYFYDQGLVRGNEGVRLENAVAYMLLKHLDFIRDTKGLETGLHYLRTKDGAEIDFAITMDNPLTQRHELTHLIEVKCSDSTPHKTLIRFAAQFPEAKAVQLVYNLKVSVKTNGIVIDDMASYLSTLEA